MDKWTIERDVELLALTFMVISRSFADDTKNGKQASNSFSINVLKMESLEKKFEASYIGIGG